MDSGNLFQTDGAHAVVKIIILMTNYIGFAAYYNNNAQFIVLVHFCV